MTPQQFEQAAKLMSERDAFIDMRTNTQVLADMPTKWLQNKLNCIGIKVTDEDFPRIKLMRELLERTISNECERHIAQIEADIAKI